ncbi:MULTISPECIES: DNA-binding protein [unclassified Streptomyces]|uniref:DNA-binding protein n=1 Tax=unclassified Streptomyces TaxID=2593676 RepID=UPI000932DBCB|nr:DNA-binding protein [Streptomyces sp. NBRC 110465]
MSDQDGATADDFPRGAGNPARRALRAAGHTRLAQLTTVTAAEVLALHGVGPKAVGVLREALAAEGLAFAGE